MPSFSGLEFMSEIMPCGLEAYGVFIFTDQAEGEVPDCLEALVGVLPEQLLAVRDPLVFLRVKGKLKGNVRTTNPINQKSHKNTYPATVMDNTN